ASHFFLGRSFFTGSKMLIFDILKGLWGRIEASNYIFQTNTSLFGFSKRFLSPKKISRIVPNAVGLQFYNKSEKYNKWTSLTSDKVLLCPSAFYPHKNLEIIFRVSELLNKN